MFKPLALAALSLSVFAMPAASALTPAELQRCQAMGATLTPKQAQIERVKADRDTLAEKEVELGEAWQEAETMSTFTGEDAENLLAEYEEVKDSLIKTERGLQGLVVQYNKDIAAYNKSCAAPD